MPTNQSDFDTVTAPAIVRAKAKLQEILNPIRAKVNLVYCLGLAGMVLFSIPFAWAARFQFPFAYFPVVIILFGAFRAKKELRRTFRQDHYEDELRALEHEPQNADDHIVRARVLSGLDFPEAALPDIRKALDMEPNNAVYRDDMVRVLWFQMKDGERALPYVEKLCEIQGDDQADAFMYHGEILTKADPDAALKSFDRAIEIDPDDSVYPLARLRFFIETGQLDKATDYLPEVAAAVKRAGSYGQGTLLELQAKLAFEQGDAKTAVKLVSQAIRLSPQNKEFYTLRADAYHLLGEYGKAEADREKAEKMKDTK